jgi:hypothetical protein
VLLCRFSSHSSLLSELDRSAVILYAAIDCRPKVGLLTPPGSQQDSCKLDAPPFTRNLLYDI